MTVLGNYGPAALKYWGAILGSAQQHLIIADMWNQIRSTQQQYGLPSPQASAADVMVLRGYANRLVNGADSLAAASPSDTITAAMMGIAPYTSQDLSGLAATPTYQVRFLNEVQLPDGTTTQAWQTAVFGQADFPQTVGGLQASIQNSAGELAAQGSESSATTPRGTSVGVSGLQITVV